ncbi:MAG: aminopeptidase P family N-terminal domain-containing protein, partial [Planctomycetia bacterium]|nr:aminopeptidase P family N-terminal domain-containing protein [Planctomycetia bacterium]
MENNKYEVRREKLLHAVKKQGCDAILVTNFTNVSYLTGFSGDDSWLLVSDHHTVLISDTRYTEQIKHDCPGLNAYCRSMGQGMISTVVKFLSSDLAKGAKIGIEGGSMTVVVRDSIAEAAADFTIVALSDPVEILREIKDESEIEAIRKAITCACRAFNAVRQTVQPWHTELDFSRELECVMLKLGSQERAFPTIV